MIYLRYSSPTKSSRFFEAYFYSYDFSYLFLELESSLLAKWFHKMILIYQENLNLKRFYENLDPYQMGPESRNI
jgi:hypothetical protein